MVEKTLLIDVLQLSNPHSYRETGKDAFEGSYC